MEGEGSDWECEQGLWAWLRDPEVRDHDCRGQRVCVRLSRQQADRSRRDQVGRIEVLDERILEIMAPGARVIMQGHEVRRESVGGLLQNSGALAGVPGVEV